MTVRVTRTVDVPAPPERVWAFISDPGKRAGAISVVGGFETDDADGRRATWHVDLPLPLVDRTVAVRTEDVARRPPTYVKFVGRSRVFRVTGEHRIEATDAGSRLHNEFVVEGRLPGVERFFRRNLDDELRNLENALLADVERDQSGTGSASSAGSESAAGETAGGEPSGGGGGEDGEAPAGDADGEDGTGADADVEADTDADADVEADTDADADGDAAHGETRRVADGEGSRGRGDGDREDGDP